MSISHHWYHLQVILSPLATVTNQQLATRFSGKVGDRVAHGFNADDAMSFISNRISSGILNNFIALKSMQKTHLKVNVSTKVMNRMNIVLLSEGNGGLV